MDELTWIDEDYNYQFVVKPEYRDRIVAGQTTLPENQQLETRLHSHRRRHAATSGSSISPPIPTANRTSRITAPEVLAPMRAALERWMDEKTETPIAAIFPAGEP